MHASAKVKHKNHGNKRDTENNNYAKNDENNKPRELH